MATGRRTKLTPELQEIICGFIAKGNYINVACRAAGIAQRTYERWIARGEEEKSGRYVAFVAAIKKAEASAEQHCIDLIEGAAVGPVTTTKTVNKPNPDGQGTIEEVTETVAPGSWHAAAWLLERKYPDRWGRRDQIEHGVTDNLQTILAEMKANRRED